MLREFDRVRKVIMCISAWVILTASAHIVQLIARWPWLTHTGIEGDPGMSISTACCFIGCSLCLILLARLR